MKSIKKILLKSLSKAHLNDFSHEELEVLIKDQDCFFNLLKNHKNLEDILSKDPNTLNINVILSSFTYHYVMKLVPDVPEAYSKKIMLDFYTRLSEENQKEHLKTMFMICDEVAQINPSIIKPEFIINFLEEKSIVGMKKFPQFSDNKDIIYHIISNDNKKDFEHINPDTVLFDDFLLDELKEKPKLLEVFFDIYSRTKPINLKNHDKLVNLYVKNIQKNPKLLLQYPILEKSFHHVVSPKQSTSFLNQLQNEFKSNGLLPEFLENSKSNEIFELIKLFDIEPQAIHYSPIFFNKLEYENDDKKIYATYNFIEHITEKFPKIRIYDQKIYQDFNHHATQYNDCYDFPSLNMEKTQLKKILQKEISELSKKIIFLYLDSSMEDSNTSSKKLKI